MIYLLDTNILSEPLKARPNQTTIERLARHEPDITTAAPVWHELMFGCLRLPRSKRRRLLQRYLTDIVRRDVPILPYDHEAAAWHADERARLTRLGRPPAFFDGQIAAVAATNGLILVTHNVRDFSRFRNLQVEDWS